MSDANDWMETVIEACIVSCIDWDEHNPRKTLANLLAWEVKMALDPAISSEAQALIEQGKNEVRTMATNINACDSYAVSPDIYWRYDSPPRGVKIFLLTKGGVAITPGEWRDNAGFIAWAPLFRRDKEEEKRLGLM